MKRRTIIILLLSELVLIALLLYILLHEPAPASAPAPVAVGETVSLNDVRISYPAPVLSMPAAADTASAVTAAHTPKFPLTWPGAVVKLADTPLLIRTDSGSMQLEVLQPGEVCYIIDPYVDGIWHRVGCRDSIGYIDAGAVDSSDCAFDYVFAPKQSMLAMTGYSAEQLELCLSQGLAGMGECFAAAEHDYGVNALFLIAICQEESASGTSSLAVSRNNLAGLGGPGGWQYFESYAACVDHLAYLLSTRYLNPNSSFFHGYTINGVSVTYCNGSSHWIGNINLYINRDLDLINAV